MNIQNKHNPFAIINEQRGLGNAKLDFTKQGWPLYTHTLNKKEMVQVAVIEDRLQEWTMQIGLVTDDLGSHGGKLWFVFEHEALAKMVTGSLKSTRPVAKLKSEEVELLAEYLVFGNEAEDNVYKLEARGVIVACVEDFM